MDERDDSIERHWHERPDVMRAFLERQPAFEQLASEVAYALSRALRQENISFSYVSSRAKSLESFVEKLDRKHYEAPLEEITDFAGARIVFLYPSDRDRIHAIIAREFEVVEREGKLPEGAEENFGYVAIHYLVKLGRQFRGARYDDIKHLPCEIQLRTVMQDSWAVLDHHLSYKQGTDVPEHLREELRALSEYLRRADLHFDRLRAERTSYRSELKSRRKDTSRFLDEPTNMDTLLEYLNLRFPSMRPAADDTHLSMLLALADHFGYRTLAGLDALLDRTREAREAMAREYPTRFACNHIHRAIGLLHAESRAEWFNPQLRELLGLFEGLVEEAPPDIKKPRVRRARSR